MENLSGDAKFLLHQLHGVFKEKKHNSFYYIDDIQSIAFGSMLGPSNTIPPANIASGREMQKLRQKTARSLEELVSNGYVLRDGYIDGHKQYVMNPNVLG